MVKSLLKYGKDSPVKLKHKWSALLSQCLIMMVCFWPKVFAEASDPAQPHTDHNNSTFVSLNQLISKQPFKARINVVAQEPLASELMYAVSTLGSDKVIWLQHQQTNDYMVEVSHKTLAFDPKVHQLQAYRVIKPILVSELTPAPQAPALKKLDADLITPVPNKSSATVTASQNDCGLHKTEQDTFWQLAKHYSKKHKVGIYDGLLALYYSNIDRFKNNDINYLQPGPLTCASVQRLAWFAKQKRSHQWYQALNNGAKYDQVIDLAQLP